MKFSKILSGLAVAAAFSIVTVAAQAVPVQTITNGPQVNPGDVSGWSAHQNRVNSRNYNRLVETNPAFRAYRMRKECAPVTDPQLHQECIQSFNVN